MSSLGPVLADPPPSRDTEGTGAWKPGGEASGGGLELGRLQVRSSWMSPKKSKTEGKVSKSCLTSQPLGKTQTNNRGTALYVFVQTRSLPQNWISRARRCVTTSNFSCFSRDQGSCSSFPRLNTAKSMWLNKQYRSFIMSDWFLITTADSPLVNLPVMCSCTARGKFLLFLTSP